MARTEFRFELILTTTMFLSIAMVPTALADGVDFATIAPKGSALIVTVKNVASTVARIEASPLGQIFHAHEIDGLATARREATAKQRAADLQKLGVEADAVPLPGPVGLALFIEHNEELDAPEVGLLLWADYADRSDLAGEIFDALIAEMEKDAGVSFEQVEIQGGAKATRVALPTEPEELDPSDPQPPRTRRPRGMDALGEVAALPEGLYFIRVGTQFFASSTVPTLEEAITAASGKGGASIAQSADWQGVAGVIGDQDAAAVLLIAPLQELLEPVFSGSIAELPIVLKELFGDVRAVALGMRGDDGESIMNVSAAAYLQGEKVGLMNLLSESTPVEPPPAFLGDDAVTYQRLNMRFGDIIAMVEELLAALPDYLADGAAPIMQQYGAGLTKAFSCLGPGIFTVSHAASGGEGPSQTFTAVKCTDEKAVNAVLATMLPSAGMSPRDFQGQIVYGDEEVGMEIGLGAGAMMIGSPAAVEQALRTSGDASVKSLSESALYQHCVAALSSGSVVGWGYTDMATTLDEKRKAILAIDAELPEAVVSVDDAAAADDGSLDILLPAQFDLGLEPALTKIDHAMLSRYFGPLIWEVHSEPKAIKVRFSWLRPAPPAAK
ncbi:MAG: hypothetical protein EXS17_06935 [Phycisphaerales bacterium]|nr:hypothetical protein [Phycisphaerales bacterium]